ncbi:MAG: NADH-quinone oxidoreductase subunit NuoE, partial [Candidatus Omnitrophica bacterium]|nr:NADH-quinone oxidoreductase subunit NuoE [Candidatus Omnitrophota bacterium]
MSDLDALRKPAEAILARYEQKQAAMLPVLRLVQEHEGYITPEAEAWVAGLLEVPPSLVHEVVTFYTLYHRRPVGRTHVQVCRNIACALRGAEGVLAALSERLGIKPGETTSDGRYTLSAVECLCACEAGPVMQVNDLYVGPVGPEIIETLVRQPEALSETPLQFRGAPGLAEPVISKRFMLKDSEAIETYLRDDGYQTARKAVTEMTPEQVIAEVTKSNLRGLGGAGFPAGKKWSFIPKTADKPKFLVVNADEGEPGTIKDRYIITKDPHRLLEGIIIAAHATGCRKAYVYIRGEYARPAEILQQAIDDAV